MKTKGLPKSNRFPRKNNVPEVSVLTRKYARTILAPLSRKEAVTATNLALELILREPNVQRDRLRIYGPSLRIEKPKRRQGAPTRLIWVRIRDRDQGVVHEVSIEGRKVIEHAVNENANPPFSEEEQSDAYRLISGDPRLGKLLARKETAIEWLSPGTHDHGRVIGARLVRIRDHRVIEVITETAVELDEGVLHEERGQQ